MRIVPDLESTFVWRVIKYTSRGARGETVTPMIYTNWDKGEPNYAPHGIESCAHLYDQHPYEWNDLRCDKKMCSICEMDIAVAHK